MFIEKNGFVINLNNVNNFYKASDSYETFSIHFEFNEISNNSNECFLDFNTEQERDEAFKSILIFINKESNLLQI